MRSNVLKVQMSPNRTATTIVTRIPGTVTCRKQLHDDAPSTRAASYRSPGIVCMAASSITQKKGKPFHALVRIRTGIAVVEFDSQG
jgi:hypothetical protein